MESTDNGWQIITVNVSSPNTPGFRGLQKVEPLTNILIGVVEAAKKVNRKTKSAVMVKVSQTRIPKNKSPVSATWCGVQEPMG